jgi:hypothetical protein
MYLEIFPFLLDFLIHLNIGLQSSPWLFLGFSWCCYYLSLFASELINLGFSLFILVRFARSLSICLFFQKPAFVVVVYYFYGFFAAVILLSSILLHCDHIVHREYFNFLIFIETFLVPWNIINFGLYGLWAAEKNVHCAVAGWNIL